MDGTECFVFGRDFEFLYKATQISLCRALAGFVERLPLNLLITGSNPGLSCLFRVRLCTVLIWKLIIRTTLGLMIMKVISVYN